ncbi:3-deoxy-D-manno-octulosonic acid transferase [Desulfobulbus rhabdoformis]|uniref:3-deoxy-D-manno-octulosonic acid transferase n=1 Tax=Desulfobulbus rhabdoformis TaxID=34032 RepID=UPI001966522B|nr:3-deoxy-D-manno-octulosonic acid transferase [Desulfobulbus rhabdoformis]MBM9615629.1 3-deoxy-D-manno-octulosonic acid transferase [Desulfobulbus rhabdoformis]
MPFIRPFYYALSSLALVCLVPLLPVIACKTKYRKRIFNRLGFGLHQKLRNTPQKTGSTIWIHALSVGEVTSALPLIRELRKTQKDALLIFSATTSSGAAIASSIIAPHVDCLIAAPLDLGPVVPYYLRCIAPDLFIQIETDFWPHWLACMQQKSIPTLLVNGRISGTSFQRYKRFQWLFAPMFNTFSLLSMQTKNDAQKMRALGLAPEKILTLGNLKFDTFLQDAAGKTNKAEQMRQEFGFAPQAPLWICGSTHPGEETVVLQLYKRLRETVDGLQLLLAPRNIERTGEIVKIAQQLGLTCRRRTDPPIHSGPVLILNTIGELATCYQMGDVAFVGGSLIDFGGHNPLEPASAGIPIFVGPHTEDFSEITQGLVEAGGIFQSGQEEEIAKWLLQVLTKEEIRHTIGARAAHWIAAHRGVVARHLEVIDMLLSSRNTEQ